MQLSLQSQGGDYLLHPRLTGGNWVYDVVQGRALKCAGIPAEVKGNKKKKILFVLLGLQCLTQYTVPSRNSNICITFEIRNSILTSPEEVLLRARTMLLRDIFLSSSSYQD